MKLSLDDLQAKGFVQGKDGSWSKVSIADPKTVEIAPKKYANNSLPEIPNPEPERDQAPTLVSPIPREAESVSRITIRFIGYRVRPLDPDNFAGSTKDLLDGLRHAGLIRGDEPHRIRLETEQVKVKYFEQEKTEIILEL